MAVTARTTAATVAPQPDGRAGLACLAVDPDQPGPAELSVFGLRSRADERANVAIYSTSDQPVTVSVTSYSGAGDARSAVVAAAETLQAYGWKQLTR